MVAIRSKGQAQNTEESGKGNELGSLTGVKIR